jgi:hypothetical protein
MTSSMMTSSRSKTSEGSCNGLQEIEGSKGKGLEGAASKAMVPGMRDQDRVLLGKGTSGGRGEGFQAQGQQGAGSRIQVNKGARTIATTNKGVKIRATVDAQLVRVVTGPSRIDAQGKKIERMVGVSAASSPLKVTKI